MRQIVCVDYSQSTAVVHVTCVFWLVAPATRVVPFQGTFVSRVPVQGTTASWGVTPTELAGLQAGTLVEQLFDMPVPAGSTNATIQAAVLAAYASSQTALNNQANAGSHYVGASYDGTSWTLGP